jgi:hypothetical protein
LRFSTSKNCTFVRFGKLGWVSISRAKLCKYPVAMAVVVDGNVVKPVELSY